MLGRFKSLFAERGSFYLWVACGSFLPFSLQPARLRRYAWM